jgi:riboflavin kinase/FMN adenylyltransferase
MEIVSLSTLRPLGWGRPSVTVGNFDGVHRGHQALVSAVLEEARLSGDKAAVLTFEPHPSRVLSPDRAPTALMTPSQKAETLASLGVERLAVLPFTEELAREGAEEFARTVLKEALGARIVVVGENFRFGRGRGGDVDALRRLGEGLSFGVRSVGAVLNEGAPISSTRIRVALNRGSVEAAAQMLGRPFLVDGIVVKGAGRGRQIGIPTANLDCRNETLPGAGVYACRVTREGKGEALAVVNVGRRPTFGGDTTIVEAHLLDFDGDLYGSLIRVFFVTRLRAERPFPGAAALVSQIREDIVEARRVLESSS